MKLAKIKAMLLKSGANWDFEQGNEDANGNRPWFHQLEDGKPQVVVVDEDTYASVKVDPNVELKLTPSAKGSYRITLKGEGDAWV